MGKSQGKGLVIVISGPSGVGKGTVIEALREQRDFGFSVSHTTRPMRPGEVDGVNYHFVTREEFQTLLGEGKMMESTCYQGNYYGTSYAAVDCVLSQGKDILLDIEIEGAANLRRACPEVVEIFLLPPSMAELERRLRGRNSETDQVIRGRLARAREEIPCAASFDYIVVNDTVEQTVAEIQKILSTAEFRAVNRTYLVKQLLNEEKK